MYLNFSNFRGRISAGGGDKPWSKNGDKCQWGGGIDNIFARWRDPQSPQEKKLCLEFKLRYLKNLLLSIKVKELFEL